MTAVVAGAAICLGGILGVVYFNLFPEEWGGPTFWRWMPISVFAVGLGVLLIAASLIIGFVSGVITRFRHKHDKDMV